MDTPAPEKTQVLTAERLRLARVMASNRAMREATAVAKALQISRGSLSRYEAAERDIPTRVLHRAVEVFQLPMEYFLGETDAPTIGASSGEPKLNKVMIEKEAQRMRESQPVAPRTFSTDAERISYALGVLDMAGRSNRIVMETSNEVSRAISAASAALLAPLSGPAPVTPGRTDAEYIAMHDAALQQAAAAVPATQGGKRRRATGR
jgi:transcriptional regulator with XRE-family HTH domain